jgi:hypothetical protein
MSLRQILLARIESYCADRGISERDFGYASVQDGRLVERLRNGKATLRLMERAEAFLDGVAPDARNSRRRHSAAPAEVAA